MVLTYTFLNHTFLKYVIVSHYIYMIYLIGFRLLDSLVFALNNSLATKIKNCYLKTFMEIRVSEKVC